MPESVSTRALCARTYCVLVYRFGTLTDECGRPRYLDRIDHSRLEKVRYLAARSALRGRAMPDGMGAGVRVSARVRASKHGNLEDDLRLEVWMRRIGTNEGSGSATST